MINKPTWLEDWLGNLNWDILTFRIYVGDAVENAIDWVLSGINTIVDWAGELGAWLEDFRQEIVDAFETFTYWINELWDYVTRWFDTIVDWLEDWWQVKLAYIRDLIGAATQWIVDLVNSAWDVITSIGVWIDSFITDILPELVSFNWLFDWWNGVSADIIDAINQNTAWLDMIRDFIDDPAQFVYDKLDEFFERFW